MEFLDRTDAGARLAAELAGLVDERPVVVALPRGGVPIGVEVARALGAPLEILAVRKLGAPGNPELGVGAVAEDGTGVLDPQSAGMLGMTQAKLDETIDELNANPECTGYIVQLPLPKQLNENAALERIDPAKDADGLHPTNLGRLVLNTAAPLPCTPRGIVHLLRRFDVEIAGAHVVVIGRGVTVGRPLGLLLTRRSENATVTLCHTGTRDLPALTKQADIIVAGVGVPHMLTADMVRSGATVIDVGVSRVDGKLAGDVRPDVWEVAGHVSPNPGGVGPLTRAFLLTNVVELAERQ